MARPFRRRKRASETPHQLLSYAVQRIGAGDGKRALKLLKRAQFKGASPKRTAPLLYLAYAIRADDLEARGMADQARAARENASRHAAAFASMVPTAGELVPLLRSLADKGSFELYARYLRSNPPHREAETVLADRVVLERCWEHLSVLDAGSRLRRDAATVASAVGTLDRGDWGGGRRLLQSLAKDSAFRAWLAFCDAMDAFVRGDARELRRAVRALPPNFPLRSSVKALRIGTKAIAGRAAAASAPVAGLFGLGRFAVPQRVQALRASIRTDSPPRIAKAIASFVAVIDPLDSAETKVQVALALALAAFENEIGYETYVDVLRRVGPARRLDLRVQRSLLQAFGGRSPQVQGTDEIARLLADIHLLYPEPTVQEVARSRILYKLAHAVSVVPAWEIDFEEFDGLAMIAGDTSYGTLQRYEKDPLAAAADLLRMSVRADPSNMDAHKRLVAVLRDSVSAKRSELVAAYEAYAQAVPEDPNPWIALAELRLSHNAYRKAESALKTASRYAGRDERVLDLLALSSVSAARRNIRNGRLGLAERDLVAAESRMGPKVEPLVRAWKGLLIFAKHKRPHLRSACEEAVASCPPIVRAEALCLVLAACNASQGRLAIPTRQQRPLWKMAGAAVGAVCSECPDELPRLVEPLPPAFECVTSSTAVVACLSAHWVQILRAVPDAVMFRVFLVAVEYRQWATLRLELLRRLPRARKGAQGRILLLYLATVRYLLGEDSGGARFHRLKASIPDAQREPVRLAADKLANALRFCFVPQLSIALREFNFAILDEPRGLF